MQCKICNTVSDKFAAKKLLYKYDVGYYKCTACGFIQTEPPYWLPEAYGNAITNLDIGLVHRNEYLVPVVSVIIDLFFNNKAKFLDYGGGYGLFVRMMRDRGFNFYRQDIFCENLFAKHFDITNLPADSKFEMVTAFEVFEHLEHPFQEIEKMLSFADNILFTTELQPEEKSDLDSWWYFTPETGQHISLYTMQSLEMIAKQFGLHLLSHNNLHLLSKTKMNSTLYNLAFRKTFQRLKNFSNRKPSLLAGDFNHVKILSQEKQ